MVHNVRVVTHVKEEKLGVASASARVVMVLHVSVIHPSAGVLKSVVTSSVPTAVSYHRTDAEYLYCETPPINTF